MGNCFGSEALADPNPSSSIDPSNSTTGTSDKFSTGGSLSVSATSSSAGGGRFSAAFSNDSCLNGEILPKSNLHIYTFADLKSCTRNFKPDMVLGVGGFGTVYKGWVDGQTLMPAKLGTGIMVAIKKLKEESMQGYAEWQSEVTFLGRLSHPNLVKLLGYCLEDKELLLVYEFMQRGSLESHLFRRNREPLSWEMRLKIALGAARGLAFLHSSEDKQIIYRDFKASNILLDENYNAKLSDFGLAKLGPSDGQSHVTTRIMGTYGYAAPEYLATGHLYVKSDVYGFGVVLLEMLTGLRALDTSRPAGQTNLVEWLKPIILYQKRKLKTIMDQRIEGQYSSNSVAQAAQLCINCLEQEPRKRPSMEKVVENLEQIVAIAKPKELKNGSSHSNHISKSPRSHHQSPRGL